jgi:hypothetical protein
MMTLCGTSTRFGRNSRLLDRLYVKLRRNIKRITTNVFAKLLRRKNGRWRRLKIQRKQRRLQQRSNL